MTCPTGYSFFQVLRVFPVSQHHVIIVGLDADRVRQAIAAGVDCCGENRVQELTQKLSENAYAGAPIHFIGHLQTNKVKYIAPFVSLIHAVDSERLLIEIDKQAKRCGRTIPILLQVHVAKETTKFGFTPDELLNFMENGDWRQYTNIRFSGIMCMATNTEDEALIASEFEQAKTLFHRIKEKYFSDSDTFNECSWGMSGDYPIAIEHGSTLIRIGSMIFGERTY